MKNNEQFETELFLDNQLRLGFNPKWFITYHYKHPSENIKAIHETNNYLGFRDRISFKTYGDIWNQVSSYNNMERMRNSYESLIKDTSQIKNCILKYLYGINRLNQEWKKEFPNLFFFHEQGKVRLQYHTHLLIPEKNCRFSNIDDLYNAFNHSIRKKRKCFSRWKQIHIREIDNPKLALSYVNKETTMKHNSLDFTNSIFILPRT